MSPKSLTNWQAVGIGALVAIGASVIVLMSFSVYFLPFIEKFILVVFPLSIIGALAGKYLSKIWVGSLLGAVVVVIVEFFWIFSIAFMIPLD